MNNSETKVSVNIIKYGKSKLIAACDFNLLGKTLKFGKIEVTIHRDFYGGSVVGVKEAISLMKKGTTANIIGPGIVKNAVEEGLIHPRAILNISGVPHAQIVIL